MDTGVRDGVPNEKLHQDEVNMMEHTLLQSQGKDCSMVLFHQEHIQPMGMLVAAQTDGQLWVTMSV